MNRDYYLYLSKEKKEQFSLPDGWTVVHYAEPGQCDSNVTVVDMVRDALEKPLGAPPLGRLVAGANRIAVIVDDSTRPTPVKEIMQVLMGRLDGMGVDPEKITIVIAIGTHAVMNDEALLSRLGEDIVSRYRVIQHNAWQSDLVPVRIPGHTKQVKINPEVARADVKIGVSSIIPHPMAGFGGGPKIIMPGVCDFEYVREHHMRYTIHPRSAGGSTKGNPFHERCMEIAKLVGLDYSINCIYNQRSEIIRIIAGSLDDAFDAATNACFEELGVRFEEKVDITITSTYPHTHGVQFSKAYTAPNVVTRESGAILMAAPLVTPIPEEFLASFSYIREQSHHKEAEYVLETMSQGLPILPDKPLEFNMAMSCVILRPSIRTILVSSMITEKEAVAMGMEYAPSVDAGIKILKKTFPEARVAIFPTGGLIIPIAGWEGENREAVDKIS